MRHASEADPHLRRSDAADIDAYVPLDDAPALIPSRPHRSTSRRWSDVGVKRKGIRIRLKTTLVGGRRFTTQRWVDEFLAACNDEPAPALTPGQRERQAKAAMEAAASMGVKFLDAHGDDEHHNGVTPP